MAYRNWSRSSAFAYVYGALPRLNDLLENLKTRILGLIQDFDSLSIFVAVLSSLLAIYPWRDPLALQTNPDEISFTLQITHPV